ncbi:carbohydrate ABC transporter permease [Eisenbergiella porci]|uniref:carbohydrate ABC transporter permease n=1 Tax=Eisenbergiella porci TaxID=2652274 RepID=UPI002A825500|nr:sugar ABC transporter permease [Eisenbergiella porci]
MHEKHSNRSVRKTGFIFLFLLPTMLCFCVFYLYPILTVIITSFAKWDYTNLTSPQIYPIKELFTNYQYIFEKYPYFREALRNSCLWALCGIVIQVPFAVLVAIALSRKLRGWKVSRNVFIIPNVICSAAMGLIFLQFYNPKYGVVNQLIQLFNPDFKDNILLIPGVNFVAMTCSYIFFAGTSMLMVLGQIFAIPTEIY